MTPRSASSAPTSGFLSRTSSSSKTSSSSRRLRSCSWWNPVIALARLVLNYHACRGRACRTTSRRLYANRSSATARSSSRRPSGVFLYDRRARHHRLQPALRRDPALAPGAAARPGHAHAARQQHPARRSSGPCAARPVTTRAATRRRRATRTSASRCVWRRCATRAASRRRDGHRRGRERPRSARRPRCGTSEQRLALHVRRSPLGVIEFDPRRAHRRVEPVGRAHLRLDARKRPSGKSGLRAARAALGARDGDATSSVPPRRGAAASAASTRTSRRTDASSSATGTTRSSSTTPATSSASPRSSTTSPSATRPRTPSSAARPASATLIENAPDAIAVYPPDDRRIVYANPALASLLGYDVAAGDARRVHRLVHPPRRPPHPRAAARDAAPRRAARCPRRSTACCARTAASCTPRSSR